MRKQIIPQNFGTPQSIVDFNEHNYLYRAGRPDKEFLKACAKANVKPRGVLSANAMGSIAQFCLAGLGIATLTDFYLKSSQLEDELVVLEGILKQRKKIELFMFYRKLKHTDKKIEVFVEFIKKKLS